MKLTRWLSIALLVGLVPVIAWGQETTEPITTLESEYFIRKNTTDQARPEYPIEAQQAGVQGMVQVFVVFDKDGKVEEVKPLVSPHEMLSEAVVKAVKNWRMTTKPYRNAPNAITWGELRFIFSLETGKAEVLDVAIDLQRKPSKEFYFERLRRHGLLRQSERNRVS